MTLADEDINSILTDTAKRAIQCYVAKYTSCRCRKGVINDDYDVDDDVENYEVDLDLDEDDKDSVQLGCRMGERSAKV